MPTVRFKIGDAFPADDAVARFVTVLAMMSNDVLRTLGAINDQLDAEDAGMRMMGYRRQFAIAHEAAEFIADAQSRFPEIRAFVASLPDHARESFGQIARGVQPGEPEYHDGWLKQHRNITFHYPEMHPAKAERGKDAVMNALGAVGDLESGIVGETNADVRYVFADEVVAHDYLS